MEETKRGNLYRMFLLIIHTADFNPQPVKFSTEPDLEEEECQQLLLECMPAHIRNTKITQRLFIKYGVYCKLRYLHQFEVLTFPSIIPFATFSFFCYGLKFAKAQVHGASCVPGCDVVFRSSSYKVEPTELTSKYHWLNHFGIHKRKAAVNQTLLSIDVAHF